MVAFGVVHAEIIPVALIVLPFYVTSPVFFHGMIYSGWKRRIMDQQNFAIRWGFLIDPFERRCWFWNSIISLRKFSFVLSAVFLQNSPYLQLFVPIFVVLLNLIANCHYRPYRAARHNILENVLMIGLLFFLISGMMSARDIVLYHDSSGKEMTGPYDVAIILSIFTVQMLTMICCATCMYYDVLEAQMAFPKLIIWIVRLVYFPLHISFAMVSMLVKLGYYGGTRLFSLNGPMMSIPDSKIARAAQFQSATAYNRAVQGDPPVVTGGRMADILWEAVMKLRSRREPSVLQKIDDESNHHQHEGTNSWLKDKFAIQKQVFLLERGLHIERTFDKRSANILRMERMLSVSLDSAIDYYKRERDHFFDLLYDAETENLLLSKDYEEAAEKVALQEDVLSEITAATNFSQVKLDAEKRRIGMPEEWKSRFLEEQVHIELFVWEIL